MSIDLLVDLCRKLSFSPSDRKEPGSDFANAANTAMSQKWVKCLNRAGVNVGCRLSTRMLLFSPDVVEGAITVQRPSESASDSIAVQVRFAQASFEWWSGIEGPIFNEKKCIAVMCV